MKKIYLVVLSLILLQTLPAIAQYSTTNKKAIKLYQEAEVLIHNRKFEEGAELLDQAIQKDPNFVEAHLKLAGIYKLYMKNDKAKAQFEKAAQLKPDSKEMTGVYFVVGEYALQDGDYDKAKTFFDKVISNNPNDKKMLESTNRNLININFALEAKKNPIPFTPTPMSPVLNKYYIQAYPVLTADQETLIFTKREGADPNDDEDIVISKKVNGQWTNPVSISDKIKTDFNEGACTMSADGKVLVFTSCNRKDGLGSCDLYITYNEGGKWKSPINLGSNVNSKLWDSEPSLSADGKKLYFTSERKGGLGMEDIWVSEMNEQGEWGIATNLGKDINSPGREVSPFIHANGKSLFFSSNYHPGMGAFDVFSSQFDGVSWSQPKNIGYPINSQNDDVTLFITADNKKGYYSKYNKKDMKISNALLYEFNVPKEIVNEVESTYAKGAVYDSETKKPLGAKVDLIDLKTSKVIYSVNSDAINGDYLIVLTQGKEYALYVQKEGYLFKSTFLNYTNPKNFDPLTLDVYLDPIKQGKAVVLNNIFFATNSYALEDKSKTELDKIVLFMNSNPKVSIELGGHTDDVGADNANMELSMKRSKSVYDYLIGKGISANRLKYKGYGETKPMVANTNEENRQLNRRIEFKIL